MDEATAINLALCTLLGLWRGRMAAIGRAGLDDMERATAVLLVAMLTAWAWGRAESWSGLAWLALVPLGGFVVGQVTGWAVVRLAGAWIP